MPIKNVNVDTNAKIASTKLNFGRTSTPTAPSIAGEALVWYDTEANGLKATTSTATYTLATVGPATLSLQGVVDLGQKVSSMDVGGVELEAANNDNPGFLLKLDNDDVTNNPPCLVIENAGAGNDITGSAFSVTAAGLATVTGLDMVDAKYARFGSSQDITMGWDATDFVIDGAAANTAIKIGATNNQDLYIYGATATNYIFFNTDDTAKAATFEHFHLELQDDSVLRFGDSDDITVTWNATDLLIDGAAADTAIKIGATNNQDLYIYAATATDFVHFNTDDTAKRADWEDFALRMMDDTQLQLGDSADVTLDWNAGGGLDVLAAADNSVITFGNGTNSFDLKVFGGDASTYVYFNADGGSGSTGALSLGADDHGIDVTLYGATSGAYLLWDESADQLVGVGGATVSLNDDVELLLGTGTSNAGDFKIYGSGTGPKLIINSVTAETGSIEIGADSLGLDVTIFSATASAGFLFDASADQLISKGASSINLIDDGELRFGTGASGGAGDLKLSSNSSNVLQLEQVVSGTGTFEIGVDNKGIDVKFYGETAGAYMLWDQSGNELLLSGGAAPAYIRLANSTLAQLDNISATGTAGQIAYCSDGAAGKPCLVFSDGSNWLRADTLTAAASS